MNLRSSDGTVDWPSEPFDARFERQLLTNHKEKHMDRRTITEARLLVTGEMVEAAYAVTGAVDQPDTCLYPSTVRHAIEAALAAAPFDVPYTTEPYPGRPGKHTKLVEVAADDPCPEPGCEYPAGHERHHPHGQRLMCANGCTSPVVVSVQLPGRVKSVCEWCAAEGGDEELLEATAILEDGVPHVR